MKARIAAILGLVSLVLALLVPASARPAGAQTAYTHDIIVYGGGFGGVAAAANAHKTYFDLTGVNPRVLLINAQNQLGGLGAINGQNFWDWRKWDADKGGTSSFAKVTVNGIQVDIQPQLGSHIKTVVGNTAIKPGTSTVVPQFDQLYATSEMSNWLNTQVSGKTNLSVLQPYDIKTVSRDAASGRINSVTVQKLKRENQAWLFDTSLATATYSAPVFIDASENGRLTRLAGVATSLGRQDRNSDRRQMVATLMFKVRGLRPSTIQSLAQNYDLNKWGYIADSNGTIGFWGGQKELGLAPSAAAGTSLYALGQFNKNNPRFQIKAMNVAEDRASNAAAPANELDRVWWVNTFLVVGVDGNCERKDGCADEGASAYPTDGLKPWSVDYAYAQARARLNTPEFLAAMRAFPGFSGMQLETITAGGIVYPAVGDAMYLRETIHTPLDSAQPISDGNFALTSNEVIYAGGKTLSTSDGDYANYANRIGLGFYWLDSNGYTKSNPGSGNLDADPIAATLTNPVYVPVDAILTAQAPNLITSGYSASISSRAWTMMRVLPNLNVLGDAAGVLAGYARTYQTDPNNFRSNTSWMTNVRNRIKLYGGRVDK
jgi:hypothetical protein